MTDKNIIQKVVLAGVIFQDNKILIIQRSKDEDIYPNLWELPSGKKEDLETVETSLVREIREETGLEIKPVKPFFVFNYQIEKQNVIKDTTQINYLVEPVVSGQSKINLSSEHQDFKWISENEIDRYNLSESTKLVLREAFKIR